MSDKIKVQAIRFFSGEEGPVGPNTDPFFVTKARFAELKANDLVEEFKGAKPAEPTPDEEPLEEQASRRGRPRKSED